MRPRGFLVPIVLVTLISVVGCGGKAVSAVPPSISTPKEQSTASPSVTHGETLAPASPTKPQVSEYPESTETGSAYPAPTDQQAYPVPSDQAYPAPVQRETPPTLPSTTGYLAATPVPVTPMPGKGVVTGVLVRSLAGQAIGPRTDTKVFLAKMITKEGDVVGIASLNEETAPWALTNVEGQFTFVGLGPGKYALIIKTALAAVLAHDVVADEDVVATVAADQVVELGEIQVDIPY